MVPFLSDSICKIGHAIDIIAKFRVNSHHFWVASVWQCSRQQKNKDSHCSSNAILSVIYSHLCAYDIFFSRNKNFFRAVIQRLRLTHAAPNASIAISTESCCHLVRLSRIPKTLAVVVNVLKVQWRVFHLNVHQPSATIPGRDIVAALRVKSVITRESLIAISK